MPNNVSKDKVAPQTIQLINNQVAPARGNKEIVRKSGTKKSPERQSLSNKP